MAIPKAALDLVNRPVVAWAGTRDASLVPRAHFTWGLRAIGDDQTEAFVPEPFVGPLRANLADNGQFTLTFSDGQTHESYQAKGRTTEVRDATDAERAFQREWSAEILEIMRSAGYPAHWVDGFAKFPSLPNTLVRFRVEQVFEQTPGPIAGRALGSEK